MLLHWSPFFLASLAGQANGALGVLPELCDCKRGEGPHNQRRLQGIILTGLHILAKLPGVRG